MPRANSVALAFAYLEILYGYSEDYANAPEHFETLIARDHLSLLNLIEKLPANHADLIRHALVEYYKEIAERRKMFSRPNLDSGKA